MTQGTPGFSNADDAGDWSGFDVDVCRAVAAAVLGDADAVNYVPLSTTERFTALQSGEVDILSRTTTRTLHRDTALGLNFAPVVFFDGQGFMVREDSGIVSAMELDVVDFFAANGMDYAPVRFERAEEVLQAYDAGQCDVYTSDRSALAARRLLMAEPAVHLLLPETISEEPLAPAVRHGDDRWFDVVTWVVYALVGVEEMDVTAENVEQMKEEGSPDVRRMLGAQDEPIGEWLDLDNDWAAHRGRPWFSGTVGLRQPARMAGVGVAARDTADHPHSTGIRTQTFR